MSINAKFSHKFSKTWIDNFKKHSRFDGEDGRPESRKIKDLHGAAHGLWLRLSVSGTMSYYVQGVLKNGLKNNQSTYLIGDARILDLDSARDKARKFKDWLAQGLNPIETFERQGQIHTLLSVHDLYVNNRTLQEDTIKDYGKQLHSINAKLLNKRIEDITSDEIIAEHFRLRDAISPAMADKLIISLEKYFNYAIHTLKKNNSKDQLMVFNPVSTIRYNKGWFVNGGKSQRIRNCIDSEDLPKLLSCLEQLEFVVDHRRRVERKESETALIEETEQKTSPPDKLLIPNQSFSANVASHLFRFLLFTGWRPEETVKIEWSQVSDDFKDISWDDEMANEKLKNADKIYRFPLNSCATDVLKSLKKYNYKSKWVFPNRLDKGCGHFKQNPTDYVNLLNQMMGKRYTLGIYRKTFQTYAEHLELLSSTIKRLVFHTQSNYDVQSGYIKSNRDTLRYFSQKIANYILQQAGRISDTKPIQITIGQEQEYLLNEKAEEFGITPFNLVTELLKVIDLVQNFKDDTPVAKIKKQINLQW